MEGDKLLNTQLEFETHILLFYEGLYLLDKKIENNAAARQDCFQFL